MSVYITTRIKEKPPQQLSFDDWFVQMVTTDWTEPVQEKKKQNYRGRVYTRTWHCNNLPERLRAGIDVTALIEKLRQFNEIHKDLHNSNLADHYETFYIPKKSGGLREINAPDDNLSNTLRELKTIFENDFYASNHAAAYAYVSGRSTTDAVKVHQRNESRWFLKTDLSGFFPSTTLDFTMRMLSIIFPFNLIIENESGKAELEKALSLCFLHGGLPMGTPISPMLTNLIMIPFDFEISKYLRNRKAPWNNSDGRGRQFAYTRYADDMHISCSIDFMWREVQDEIRGLFEAFGAPYVMKPEKTHYGSRAGSNWMLGVMLNKDNEITIGHKKKRTFEAIMFNYIKDRESGKKWSSDELSYTLGLLSYYRNVNKQEIDSVVDAYGRKYGLDIENCMKADLNAA